MNTPLPGTILFGCGMIEIHDPVSEKSTVVNKVMIRRIVIPGYLIIIIPQWDAIEKPKHVCMADFVEPIPVW